MKTNDQKKALEFQKAMYLAILLSTTIFAVGVAVKDLISLVFSVDLFSNSGNDLGMLSAIIAVCLLYLKPDDEDDEDEVDEQ